MQIVLMAGGKGTRLWPLSTNDLPKQFISTKDMNNSMLTSTYNKVNKLNKKIYVATQKKYSDIVFTQTGRNVKVVSEPYSHDTFAAFLNIAVYLKFEEDIPDNEMIALLPVDHDVSEDFYNILEDAKMALELNQEDFCLIGIKPNYPSTQYGYILYKNSYVKKFLEKPSEDKAIELINEGAVWNSGILIFRLKAMLEISKKYCLHTSYQEFIKKYNSLPKNSFDYEVLEKLDNIMIVLSNKKWKDLGNWNSLYEKISKPDNYNSNIINDEDKEIRNCGVENSIIINAKEGLALYPKNLDYKKKFRNWGYYEILDNYIFNNMTIKIKHLKILKNKNISYQKHNFRNEFWMIIDGCGEVIKDGKLKTIKKGDTYYINIGDKHSIKATETLEIIEIQYGSKTIEEDIERITYDWDEISKF